MRRHTLTIAVGLLAAFATTTGAAHAAAPAAQPFAWQAEAADLTRAQATALQSEVDTYLAELGGTQVALNQIDLDGAGAVLVALPGEAQPRDFTSEGGRAAAADRCLNAAWYTGYFCAYQGTHYTGTRIDMWDCGKVMYIPGHWGRGSWINNQSRGMRGYMYDNYDTTIYVTPGARSYHATGDWGPVGSMIPC
ncbi:hypothetical protein [Marinitenerispora sediminis]|uniref:Peptidase M23 n=1 Tax=Marinitenerispora sediminis TaxID=1931232 RepID=A0A368TA73_9ACTN|nr:hypothetical protein [Marinitenerispora sediminis]RCV53378.1 hypothetical protein DEF28_10485 [Marinitenerispora sediminis]RCV58426.1 hypothetical protein DEF23_08885 [Marinitenerispora sediminis]RCV61793.1 hypothetical protein DEF24_03485 [Marinitenerispora sediminis]